MFGFISLHNRDAKKIAPANASVFLDKAITAIQARDYSAFKSATNLTTDIEFLTLEYSHDLLAKDFKSNFSLYYISEIKISEKRFDTSGRLLRERLRKRELFHSG
jgi:hypothetical protein